jgi:hypothetical protein
MIMSRRMRWAGYVKRMREKMNTYSILVVKPEGMSPLRRPRRRWEDNIKWVLDMMVWYGLRIRTSGGLL